jgi:hypothetical protein
MVDIIFNDVSDILFYNTEDVLWKRNAPTVQTSPVTSFEGTTVGHGSLLDLGGEKAFERGLCYKLGGSEEPTIDDVIFYEEGSFGVDTFQRLITGLSEGREYGIRAYAINSEGIGYGLTIFFESGGVVTCIFRDIITSISRIKKMLFTKTREVLCTPVSLHGRITMLEFSQKQSYEQYYVAFNFVRVITPLTSIASVDVHVYDELGTDVSSTLTDASKLHVSGAKVFVWVCGGNEQTYKITCKIVMTNDEKFEQDALLEVMEI